MRRSLAYPTIGILICATGLALTGLAKDNSGNGPSEESAVHYAVTITNLMKGEVLTPIVVASHKEGVTLFTLGQPASAELEQLAEGGLTQPLEGMLMANPKVLDVKDSGAPLPPGASVTVTVRGGGGFDEISLASMLVPTNDGFFAIQGAQAPSGNRTVVLYSPAYDAGTEANDESCTHIPGPPNVCQGEGFNASRAGAEGFVHIHEGIHGIASLQPSLYDWRNPVAQIVIRRVNQ